ncbi:MAG: hypothetical protein ABFS16_08165 [Bacteroidota bacterium]
MKVRYLFISLFILAAVLFVDYILAVSIGIIANVAGAEEHFFQDIYPFITYAIIAASIVISLFFVTRNRFHKKGDGFIHTISHVKGLHLKRSA